MGEAELGNCAMCVKPDATMKAISRKAELGICACVKPDATMKEISSKEESTNEWSYLIASEFFRLGYREISVWCFLNH